LEFCLNVLLLTYILCTSTDKRIRHRTRHQCPAEIIAYVAICILYIDQSIRYRSAIDRSIIASRQSDIVLRNRSPPVRSAQPTRPVRQLARQTHSLHKRIYRARHVTVGRTDMVLIIIVSTQIYSSIIGINIIANLAPCTKCNSINIVKHEYYCNYQEDYINVFGSSLLHL